MYNQGWLGDYGSTNIYRSQGASQASQYGAVATLIQSVAPFSLNTPHTVCKLHFMIFSKRLEAVMNYFTRTKLLERTPQSIKTLRKLKMKIVIL